MYVVIAGINTLTRRLVGKLEDRHDVVVIDADEDECKRLYSSSGATVINKEPSTLTALEDAGIDQADVLIAAQKDDNQNMVVCSLGKKYGVPKVVSRLEDEAYFDAFDIIGAETVGHTDLLISEFISSVEHPYLVKLANLSNDREVLKASIVEDSKLIDRTPDQIEDMKGFPKRFNVASVLQPENTFTKDVDVELGQEDEVVLIGPTKDKEQLDKFFQRQ